MPAFKNTGFHRQAKHSMKMLNIYKQNHVIDTIKNIDLKFVIAFVAFKSFVSLYLKIF